ncbi:MAG: hypothetical protein U0521_24520 [Anaerolineae bacterium]
MGIIRYSAPERMIQRKPLKILWRMFVAAHLLSSRLQIGGDKRPFIIAHIARASFIPHFTDTSFKSA